MPRRLLWNPMVCSRLSSWLNAFVLTLAAPMNPLFPLSKRLRDYALGNTAWFYAPSALDAWIAGIALIAVSLWALARPGTAVTEWVRIVLGVWLFFVPWILGFVAGGAVAWTAWIIGILTVALALWKLLEVRSLHTKAPSF